MNWDAWLPSVGYRVLGDMPWSAIVGSHGSSGSIMAYRMAILVSTPASSEGGSLSSTSFSPAFAI